MGKLDNKIAVITGGTSGIGLATAQLFIEEGAKVIVTGRNPETLNQAKTILGSGADVIAADTSDLKAVEQLFKTIAERYKKIDALFVNAGIAKFAPLAQSTPEIFDEQFNVTRSPSSISTGTRSMCIRWRASRPSSAICG